MSGFISTLKGLPLDAYVTVTTRAGRTFTGAVMEQDENEFALMVRRRVDSVQHAIDMVHIALSEISSFEDHRDAAGSPLGCFFDFDTTGAAKVPTVKMSLVAWLEDE